MAPNLFKIGLASVGGLLAIAFGQDYYRLRETKQELILKAKEFSLRPMKYNEDPKRYKVILHTNYAKNAFYDYVRDIFHAGYVEYELLEIKEPGEAHRFMEALKKKEWDGIIPMGEDILKEVLHGMEQTNETFTLGYIPLQSRDRMHRLLNYFNDAEQMKLMGQAALDIVEGRIKEDQISQFSQEKKLSDFHCKNPSMIIPYFTRSCD